MRSSIQNPEKPPENSPVTIQKVAGTAMIEPTASMNRRVVNRSIQVARSVAGGADEPHSGQELASGMESRQ